jgi:VWFA-related protein
MPAGATELQVVLNRLTGYRRPSTAPDRISDYEAMRIHLYRDDEVAALVARRVARTSLHFGDLEQGRPAANVIGVQDIAGDVFEQVRARNRATLRRLARVVGSLSSGLGRKSVILVSDGFVHDPGLEEFKWVTQAALAANAAIYFVNARGLEEAATAIGPEQAGPRSTSTEDTAAASYRDIGRTMFIAGQESEGANVLASDSGGFTIRNTSRIADGLWRIVRESRTYYLIGYAPTNTQRDGKFRKIEVKVARRGLEVRARKGYYVAKEGEPLTAAPDAADEATRQRLTSPFEEQGIPLRMTAYALGRAAEGRVRVLLAAEADPAAMAFSESGTRYTGKLGSAFEVASLETGLLFQTEREVDLDLAAQVRARLARTWVPLSGSFDLPPGSYQAKLLVRDLQGEGVGTIRHAFEVPPVDRLRISTPILTDTFQTSPEGATDADTPVPLARRSFALGVQLELRFEVYEAMLHAPSGRPRVKLTYGVERAGGPEPKLHSQRIFADREGLLSQRIKIPLRGIPPGDYAVLLTVTDEVAGESVHWREPFVVEAPDATGAAGPGSR